MPVRLSLRYHLLIRSINHESSKLRNVLKAFTDMAIIFRAIRCLPLEFVPVQTAPWTRKDDVISARRNRDSVNAARNYLGDLPVSPKKRWQRERDLPLYIEKLSNGPACFQGYSFGALVWRRLGHRSSCRVAQCGNIFGNLGEKLACTVS